MAVRACWSCGTPPHETRFPVCQIEGLPDVCLDCALEWASDVRRIAGYESLWDQERTRLRRDAGLFAEGV